MRDEGLGDASQGLTALQGQPEAGKFSWLPVVPPAGEGALRAVAMAGTRARAWTPLPTGLWAAGEPQESLGDLQGMAPWSVPYYPVRKAPAGASHVLCQASIFGKHVTKQSEALPLAAAPNQGDPLGSFACEL